MNRAERKERVKRNERKMRRIGRRRRVLLLGEVRFGG